MIAPLLPNKPRGVAQVDYRMVLADWAYDAGWLRAVVAKDGGWANIPPKRNRRDPVCFSPWLYGQRNLIERSFNKLKY